MSIYVSVFIDLIYFMKFPWLMYGVKELDVYNFYLFFSRTLLFGLNISLTSVFNFTALLSYRVIRVFLE